MSDNASGGGMDHLLLFDISRITYAKASFLLIVISACTQSRKNHLDVQKAF
jgi:hypothetical protein